jgi:hypothetical protein
VEEKKEEKRYRKTKEGGHVVAGLQLVLEHRFISLFDSKT